MGTTARSVLRSRVGEITYGYVSSTLTTGGASTTQIDTTLANKFTGDDAIKGWWMIITASANGAFGEFRRVTDFVSSSGTITIATAFSTDTSTSTYELHELDLVDVHNMISRGIENLFPTFYNPTIDETLVVDNLLSNHDFETFSGGAFTNWVSKGTPTIAQETSRVFHGSSSASITASGATEGLEQNIYTSVNLNDLVGKTVFVVGRSWCDTASSARIRLTFDGTTFFNSSFQSGDEEWELLDITQTVPAGATELTISCEVVDTVTAFFDLVVMYINPVYRYTIPTTISRGPHFVTMQLDRDRPAGDYRKFLQGDAPVAGRILRLRGIDVLSRPTADAGTTEVDGERVNAIVQQAKAELGRLMFGRTQELRYQGWVDEAERWLAINLPRMSMTRSAEMPEAWGVESSGVTRELVFKAGR